jgi:hypothetical protein
MHRIDGTDHVANLFSDGDPAQGVKGTVITDDWLNSVQEEIAGLLEGMGVTLEKANRGQLLAACVAAATADKIVRRDAAGRAQFADPSAAADAATKGYVDGRSPASAVLAKTADQQVTSSAVAVSTLVVPVVAGGLYEIEFLLRTSIPNGNQPYIALTGPASPTRLGWSLEYPGTAFAWLAQQDSAYYERQLPVMPINEQLLRVRLVIDNGANAGNVGLTVRGSAAEYVRRGSFVRFARLA